MTAHLWDPYNTLLLSVLRNPEAIVPSVLELYKGTPFLDVAKGHPTSDHAEPGIRAKGLGLKEELWGPEEELWGSKKELWGSKEELLGLEEDS